MCHMMKKTELNTLYEKLTQELRRGILVLATLSQLGESKYGYDLISHFSEAGLEVEQGTLYPLLRRLEGQGVLESEWNVEGSRPRRYYKISPAGEEVLGRLAANWREMADVMEGLLRDTKGAKWFRAFRLFHARYLDRVAVFGGGSCPWIISHHEPEYKESTSRVEE